MDVGLRNLFSQISWALSKQVTINLPRNALFQS